MPLNFFFLILHFFIVFRKKGTVFYKNYIYFGNFLFGLIEFNFVEIVSNERIFFFLDLVKTLPYFLKFRLLASEELKIIFMNFIIFGNSRYFRILFLTFFLFSSPRCHNPEMASTLQVTLLGGNFSLAEQNSKLQVKLQHFSLVLPW